MKTATTTATPKTTETTTATPEVSTVLTRARSQVAEAQVVVTSAQAAVAAARDTAIPAVLRLHECEVLRGAGVLLDGDPDLIAAISAASAARQALTKARDSLKRREQEVAIVAEQARATQVQEE